ncbi:MAG: dihydroneopterin aldolase [Alphaproteobacteria bacterium]|jgi:7,8-dihydroneopterin aldolase/epimerase/oxygenase|nr:dihydroneopterin aldolase [Alphaproteobacteria bacterium]
MSDRTNVHPLRIADAKKRIRHVFVRDLELNANIGVYRREKGTLQPVRINLDLTVEETDGPVDDKLENVVDYGAVVEGIKTILAGGHLNLVETLAEKIAAHCLEDKRVKVARVRIEKLKILPEAQSVGVEIEREAER